MSCSRTWRTVKLRATKPSARSPRMPTSFFGSFGPLLPDSRPPRVLPLAERAAHDRDQVLVVRAARLVLVGERRRLAAVVEDPVLLARRIVRRRLARRRLGVEARHDHDAVVVAR